MEVEVISVEGLGIEEEDFDGRRRSARHKGKKRPSYFVEKQIPSDKKVVRKRSRLTPGEKVQKSLHFTSEINELIVPTVASAVCGDDIKLSGLSNCNGLENGAINNCCFTVNEMKEVYAAPKDVDQRIHKLKNEVYAEAPLMKHESIIDPHAGHVKSDRQRVKETLRIFNTYFLQLIQEEEKRVKEVEHLLKGSKNKKLSIKADDQISSNPATRKSDKETGSMKELKRAAKRPDLKAISKMRKKKEILYPEKRIGDLPGIAVGDQFFSRAEMCVLGLHSHWLNGIDYMGDKFSKMDKYKNYTFPLAVCIVLSGMYEDDVDHAEEITYTGQGGHDLVSSMHQVRDQKLVRGNLALKNNCKSGAPVRVIRGHVSKSSYCGKVYTYDGLYQVVKDWVEKGVSGYTVYKYKLKRAEGQPSLTTNQVQFTRAQAPQSISELRGLVCEDISVGQENLPVPATNTVDDPPFAPTDFEYCKAIRLPKNFKLPTNVVGCKCKGKCIDSQICSCARLNGGNFPYVQKDGGRLIEAKSVVFECGPGCGCDATCLNRTSQQGLKYRLEVFRTAKKGWAVRSWDTIPAGAPVCEYTGIFSRTDEVDADVENNYIFDIDCLQTMKGLDGRERRPGDLTVLENFDDKKADHPDFCIDAGQVGGVARFINHSCEPNLFVQCVLSTHHDIKMAKIMLFAADTIPPLQELSYDYGYALDSVVKSDGSISQLACFCGASGCRKRLY